MVLQYLQDLQRLVLSLVPFFNSSISQEILKILETDMDLRRTSANFIKFLGNFVKLWQVNGRELPENCMALSKNLACLSERSQKS